MDLQNSLSLADNPNVNSGKSERLHCRAGTCPSSKYFKFIPWGFIKMSCCKLLCQLSCKVGMQGPKSYFSIPGYRR